MKTSDIVTPVANRNCFGKMNIQHKSAHQNTQHKLSRGKINCIDKIEWTSLTECGENAITYQNFLIVRAKKRNAAYSMNDAIFTDEKGKADKKLPRWQVIWDLLPHVCT